MGIDLKPANGAAAATVGHVEVVRVNPHSVCRRRDIGIVHGSFVSDGLEIFRRR